MKQFIIAGLVCSLFLLPVAALAQVPPGGNGLPPVVTPQAPGPTQTPTERPTIILPDNFQPNITTQELQRAIILGNPPRRPYSPPPVAPPWFKRPSEIPTAYHGRHNNGEIYLP